MAITDAVFSTKYNIDKIVKVWEGSYNRASTTTRTDGFVNTIYVYSFAHGFDRPLFTTLLWSEDNVNWRDGGTYTSGEGAIAFSSATNISIATTTNSGTLYYKLIGYWIDDYDSSNPSIEPFTNNVDKFLFDSRSNYLKIAKEGTTTYSAGTFGSTQTVSISHDLGYIPKARAFFEPVANEIWPLNAGGNSNRFLYKITQDEAYLQIYNDRVDIKVFRFSNASRGIWYRIYYDA